MLSVGISPAVPLQLEPLLGLFILIAFILIVVVLIVAVISLPFVLLYYLAKFLISDTFHDNAEKVETAFTETGMKLSKATRDFERSPEGQITMSVLEGVAKRQQKNGRDHTSTTIRETNTKGTTQTSTTTQNTPDSLFDMEKEKKKLEAEIREQGVDPYDPAHDTDIEALLEDIEDKGKL